MTNIPIPPHLPPLEPLVISRTGGRPRPFWKRQLTSSGLRLRSSEPEDFTDRPMLTGPFQLPVDIVGNSDCTTTLCTCESGGASLIHIDTTPVQYLTKTRRAQMLPSHLDDMEVESTSPTRSRTIRQQRSEILTWPLWFANGDSRPSQYRPRTWSNLAPEVDWAVGVDRSW